MLIGQIPLTFPGWAFVSYRTKTKREIQKEKRKFAAVPKVIFPPCDLDSKWRR
jgi:hypothetical protein